MKLGQIGKDKITGFTGLIMAFAQYLTGCNQVMLVPRELDKEGKRRDGEWFDDARVVVIDDSVLVLDGTQQHPGADEIHAPLR